MPREIVSRVGENLGARYGSGYSVSQDSALSTWNWPRLPNSDQRRADPVFGVVSPGARDSSSPKHGGDRVRDGWAPPVDSHLSSAGQTDGAQEVLAFFSELHWTFSGGDRLCLVVPIDKCVASSRRASRKDRGPHCHETE